jgi:prenylcysteine oxidase/farnesylcysteine lyase
MIDDADLTHDHRLISKMEMEIISSRNIVDLLLNEGFGSSICGPRISGTEEGTASLVEENFVFGWDC